MDYIRKAAPQDASRLAEILIFAKRMHYRSIFHNDKVSFGEMQVLPLAQEYLENEEKTENVWVYDDEFVKGMIHVENNWIGSCMWIFSFRVKGLGPGWWILRSKNLMSGICSYWKRMRVRSGFIRIMDFY